MAVGHEGLRKARLALQLGHGGSPLGGHHRRHAVAALGIVDRRLQQVGKGQLAETLVQGHPAGHHAGHGDRVPAALGRARGLPCVACREVLARPGRRRATGRVQAVQLPAVPDDGEGITAQTVADGFEDGHRRRRGNGGIHRIATLPEHAQARAGRCRMGGGHQVAGEDGQAQRGVWRVVKERFHGRPRPNHRMIMRGLAPPCSTGSIAPRAGPPRAGDAAPPRRWLRSAEWPLRRRRRR
jgi:hypothetical protein